ncbi:MAG: hypothetical protein U0175_33490 [Caldilineaceae bacterium]
MVPNRFKFSSQVLPYTIVALLLSYILFSAIQPVGSAWGASLWQSLAGTATVPPYLNYQGVLRDVEGKPMSGLQKMTFRIYDRVSAPLNEARWTEEHTDVTVRNGQFSVLLGNTNPVPPQLFTSPDLFIGVTVAPFDEMTPRQRLASAPYAMYADHAAALTAPNGNGSHAVHVDESGKVGIGVTSPQAQLQISATTGSALQVNAGGQQLVMNNSGLLLGDGSKVGIGTNAPTVPIQVHNDDPDMMLDINNASASQRSEYLFGVDGQRRASVYYDKSTGQAGMDNGATSFKLYNNGLVETQGSLGVNGMIHSSGNTWVSGDLVMGANAVKPVLIKRFTALSEDQAVFDTGISAAVYQCTNGAWSTGRYDISEDSRDADMVWLFIGDNSNWYIHTKFMSDGQPDETPHIDVLCFLNGLVQYDESSGSRWDTGE